MSRTMTIGLTVLAGAALLEAALIPGLLIGGAVVLAPKYLGLGRRLRPTVEAARRRAAALVQPSDPPDGADRNAAALPTLRIGQAVAKTITFRIIVTTLDFSSNLIVIGELNTAAGLTAFNFVAGPLFYLAHEATWNYLGPAEHEHLAVLARAEDNAQTARAGGFTLSRALAKTITFRSIATVIDFTATYVAVRDIATAAGLSAFGFVVGPFVYYGHEKAWDYYLSRGTPAPAPPSAPKLLPAPA